MPVRSRRALPKDARPRPLIPRFSLSAASRWTPPGPGPPSVSCGRPAPGRSARPRHSASPEKQPRFEASLRAPSKPRAGRGIPNVRSTPFANPGPSPGTPPGRTSHTKAHDGTRKIQSGREAPHQLGPLQGSIPAFAHPRAVAAVCPWIRVHRAPPHIRKMVEAATAPGHIWTSAFTPPGETRMAARTRGRSEAKARCGKRGPPPSPRAPETPSDHDAPRHPGYRLTRRPRGHGAGAKRRPDAGSGTGPQSHMAAGESPGASGNRNRPGTVLIF